MKKNISKIVIALSLLSIITACTSEFDDTNIDPNLTTSVTPGSLINPVIYGIASNNASKNYDITSALMQVHVPYPDVTAGGVHRYDITQGTGNSTWSSGYNWLANVNEMLKRSKELNLPNYEAISLTLRAWEFSNLTDMFGDIPMSEALRAEEGISQPKFDIQKEIYETLLNDLERANSLYNSSIPLPYTADLLYNNNVLAWQKFTNSLHLRLLLRTSNKTDFNSTQKIITLLNDPVKYPIFASNQDNAVLQVTGISPNISPWPRPQDFNNGRAMASFFVEKLVERNDPRINFIATPARDLTNTEIGFKGIPAGYNGSEVFDYAPSGLVRIQAEAPMKIVIMTYAEVEFIKAEMAQKGLYVANAETHYTNGVKAAIEFLTQQPIPTTYFDNTTNKYNGTLEQIMTQKYLSLYFVDYQQWYEYRRTGFPVLPKITSGRNNNTMPSRLLYPTSVQTHNYTNYIKALETMGPDDVNTKVWWEK